MRRLLVSAALVALALAGCGSSSSEPASGSAQKAAKYAAPGEIKPVKVAPPLALRNFDGRNVNIAAYKGKAVLVTFIYVHCPDVCPLIVSNLRTAQKLLGANASKMQVIAVSADPAQDTPGAVRSFLSKRLMLGHMDYLLGTKRQLRRVWAAWGIKAKRVSSRPDAVEHSALIYGITGSGKLAAFYPSNFNPKWVAHDVPLLAAR